MELEEILGKYEIKTDPSSMINLDGTLIFQLDENDNLQAVIQNEGHNPKVIDDVDYDFGEADGAFRYHGMKIKFHCEINEDGTIKGDADAGLMDIEFTGHKLDDDDDDEY